MHFKLSSKPAWIKLPPDNCRRQFQAQCTRGYRTFAGKLGLGHQQPLSKWYMYAPWINICENHIFISSKQFGTWRVIKKQMERVISTGISGIQKNQAIATDTPSAWVSFQLIGVTLGVSGISISTLPLESCRDFDMMGHPVGNSLVFH